MIIVQTNCSVILKKKKIIVIIKGDMGQSFNSESQILMRSIIKSFLRL